MKLEEWLKDKNIKEMAMKNLKFYLEEYKKEDEDDYLIKTREKGSIKGGFSRL